MHDPHALDACEGRRSGRQTRVSARDTADLSMLPQEEEDGSEDDGDSKTQFTVTVRPDVSAQLGFLDHMDEEADGFISPVDELSPSKGTTDMRLSNLHSATT